MKSKCPGCGYKKFGLDLCCGDWRETQKQPIWRCRKCGDWWELTELELKKYRAGKLKIGIIYG